VMPLAAGNLACGPSVPAIRGGRGGGEAGLKAADAAAHKIRPRAPANAMYVNLTSLGHFFFLKGSPRSVQDLFLNQLFPPSFRKVQLFWPVSVRGLLRQLCLDTKILL